MTQSFASCAHVRVFGFYYPCRFKTLTLTLTLILTLTLTLTLTPTLTCEAMLALGTALGNLSLVVLHNAGVARAEAAARLKASDDCWRRLSAAHMRALYQQRPALLWRR